VIRGITMPRTQISIKLDEDLLARGDALAESAGANRTAVIEQDIKNDLPEQEAFQRSLENPVIRAIHKHITRPGMLQLIARLANERMSEEELAAVFEKAPRQHERAKRRVAERKGREPMRKNQGGPDA
jgi:metal-responsive CopG/Arc/MetJ family transcriptional regulator